jgi:hypothetical protein
MAQEEGAAASVSISFPTLSRAVTDLAGGAIRGRSLPQARPFFRATRVVVRLLDSTGAPIDAVDIESDSQNGDSVKASFAVEPGSYRAEADIYNSYSSAIVPVAAGTSGIFSVTAGGTTSIAFPCLPVNPTELSAGTESQAIDLTPFVYGPTYGSSEYREERWFSYTATGRTILSARPGDPARKGYFLAVYDSLGSLVGSLDGYGALSPDGSRAMSIPMNQGDRYYIGAISYGYNLTDELALLPSVFSVCARPDLFESLAISGGSGQLVSTSIDPGNYAAALVGGSELSLTAVGRIPGTTLAVDGAPAAFGSAISLPIGPDKRYVDLVATDELGRTDARRIWIARAIQLSPGQRAIGTSLWGEDIYFFMPIEPSTSYVLDWTCAGDGNGLTADVLLSACDEDGNVYLEDFDRPRSQTITSAAGASCLIVRASTDYPGFGGTLGLTVAKE